MSRVSDRPYLLTRWRLTVCKQNKDVIMQYSKNRYYCTIEKSVPFYYHSPTRSKTNFYNFLKITSRGVRGWRIRIWPWFWPLGPRSPQKNFWWGCDNTIVPKNLLVAGFTIWLSWGPMWVGFYWYSCGSNWIYTARIFHKGSQKCMKMAKYWLGYTVSLK